jgi:hypothetical protein
MSGLELINASANWFKIVFKQKIKTIFQGGVFVDLNEEH